MSKFRMYGFLFQEIIAEMLEIFIRTVSCRGSVVFEKDGHRFFCFAPCVKFSSVTPDLIGSERYLPMHARNQVAS
jgi:hypothetical protein